MAPPRCSRAFFFFTVCLLTAIICLVTPRAIAFARIFGKHSGITLTQPEALALHAGNRTDMRPQVVPKIIHQIFHNWQDPGNETMPADWDALRHTIIEHNPDYEYKLWNDFNSRKFIQEEYPWFLSTYDGLPEKVQKVDILKYFLMRHYGGIYIDLDNGVQKSLDSLLYYPTFLADGGECSLSNNILGAEPNHPFWVMFTENLASYCHNYLFPYVTISLAGGQWYETLMWEEYHHRKPTESPSLVRLMIDNRPGSDPEVIFTTGRGASWHSWDSHYYDWAKAHLQLCFGAAMLLTTLGLLVSSTNKWLHCARRRVPARQVRDIENGEAKDD